MSVIFDNDILIHHIAAPGLPGDGFTAPEAADLRADIDTLLARPGITELDDIPDVDAPDPGNGMALAYHAASGTWRPVEMGAPIYAQVNGTATRFGPVDIFDFRSGLQVQAHPDDPELALVTPVYGTVPNTVAEGSHTHILSAPIRASMPPSGYVGGGTRTIGSAIPASVTLASGINYVVEAAVYGQFRGADTGAARYTLNLNIGGTTYSSPGGEDGFWCVQGVPDKFYWEYGRKIAGTGNAVLISASVSFHSGAGFNVDRTYLRVHVRPER